MGVRGIGRERESMSSTWVQFRVGQRSEPGCGRACGAAESGTLDTGGGLVGDSGVRICWWSYGLQLKEFRTKEACEPMRCCLRTISRLKRSFMG